MAGEISKLIKHIENEIYTTTGLERKIQTYIGSLVTSAYRVAMASTDGYCLKFPLPASAVMGLFKILNLDKVDVEKEFRKSWLYPSANTRMYSDPYYHILLLLAYYGLKHKREIIVNHAMFLIFIKIWNGRKSEFLNYCDVRVMKYVITHMLSQKHKFAVYDSPLSLISNYFVPTLIKKYGPEVMKDEKKLKILFSQSWSRVRQMFANTPGGPINPKTKKRNYQKGIVPLYYEAHRGGYLVSNPYIHTDDDNPQAGIDQYATTHIRDEIAETTTDFITSNRKQIYPVAFISQINKETKVSTKILNKIFQAIHNHKFYDNIHELYITMLSKVNITDKLEVCKSSFMLNIKQKVISSKNNHEARRIQKILDIMLVDIIQNDIGTIQRENRKTKQIIEIQPNFNKYSNVQKIQIRKAVILALIFLLKKNICYKQVSQYSAKRNLKKNLKKK